MVRTPARRAHVMLAAAVIAVVAVVVAAASIRPTSMEPESPMKIRAGWKLCGRNPRQAPANTTEITAGG